MSTHKLIALITLGLLLFGCSVTTKPQKFDNEAKTQPKGHQDKVITINTTVLKVEVANTLEKQITGLSNRDSMPQDSGMLFIFDKTDKYEFWMKDMKFPLDFIWLSGDKVVDLNENIPKPSSNDDKPARVKPKEPISSIIEVNAGWIKVNNVKIGDIVSGL